MDFKFQSADFGALVLGREILKKEPNATLELWVEQKNPPPPLTKGGKVVCEFDLWESALQKILSEITRFGRIGIFYDRKNVAAKEFCKILQVKKLTHKPQDKRAEKSPQFHVFETQVLHHMANEGCADTVEFRRLARKFLRHAKNAHCDTVFFTEAIFGEEKTRKILQHLAGTQMKVVVASDFAVSAIPKSRGANMDSRLQKEKRSITIHTSDTPEFTKIRAERILQTKLNASDIQERSGEQGIRKK